MRRAKRKTPIADERIDSVYAERLAFNVFLSFYYLIILSLGEGITLRSIHSVGGLVFALFFLLQKHTHTDENKPHKQHSKKNEERRRANLTVCEMNYRRLCFVWVV